MSNVFSLSNLLICVWVLKDWYGLKEVKECRVIKSKDYVDDSLKYTLIFQVFKHKLTYGSMR